MLQANEVSQDVQQDLDHHEVGANPAIAEEELLEVQLPDGSMQYMTAQEYMADSEQHHCTAANEYSPCDMYMLAHGQFGDQNSQPSVMPMQHADLPLQCSSYQEQHSTLPFASNSSAPPDVAFENAHIQDCIEEDDSVLCDLQPLAQQYGAMGEHDRSMDIHTGLSQLQSQSTNEERLQVAIAIGGFNLHSNVTKQNHHVPPSCVPWCTNCSKLPNHTYDKPVAAQRQKLHAA